MIYTNHGHRIESVATGEHVLYADERSQDAVDTFDCLAAAQHAAKVRSLVLEYVTFQQKQEEPDFSQIRKILAAGAALIPAEAVELPEAAVELPEAAAFGPEPTE